MNEYIEVRLRRGGRGLRVRRQLGDGSIELDERDPIQRSVYVGFDAADEITRYRMRRIGQLHDWAPGQFRLQMAAEDGTLVLRGVDPFALPEGRYAVRLRLEEAKTRQAARSVRIAEDGHAVLLVDVETDSRTVRPDLPACDPLVRRLLDASTLDGEAGAAWVENAGWRASRRACLLNLLASLRARPTVSQPLIDDVEGVFAVSNDRAYARVRAALLPRLEALAADRRKPFYREGRPRSEVHRKLIAAIPAADQPLFSPDRLVSFRGEGRPSLQTVVAEPPAGLGYTYAEFDLDLGNVLQDVAGFVVHMGELLDGRPTNHLDLRKTLARTHAGRFLAYTIADG